MQVLSLTGPVWKAETTGNPETTHVCLVRVLKQWKPDLDWVPIWSVNATEIVTPLYNYSTVKRKIMSHSKFRSLLLARM